VESGHAIGSSLPILRSLYSLGARYMTLTHGCNTPWADASQVEEGSLEARNDGLSEFGEQIVLEMNRLGMLVDLSHVSADTMRQAIRVSKAPVIFSHSSSRAVSAHARNVPDDVLTMVKANRGIVMVNFYACFLVDDCDSNNATVKDIVKHINHIRKIAGVDSVGIGGDFNGVETPPVDISDVSHYPEVFEALIEDGEVEWTDEDLGKLASGNIIRVFKEVEIVRDELAEMDSQPDNSWLPIPDLEDDISCVSQF